MLLGSDRRPKDNGDPAAGGARSDTIMLIRLDPSKKATAMMSLPRDLKVQIPGHGTDKINAAYEIGGPKLTLKTVKLLTGLSVNHVINVDFRGFWAATNAVGCVYADIDRRYFNNSPGFAYINVQPGYQKMCGRKALQYVRFRHEDNDLVRSARQQDFLRQAKQQIGVSKLIGDRDKLVKIFGKYTTSDIRGTSEVLRLLKLAVFSVGQPVREVHFEGQITSGDVKTNTPSYVEASNAQIKKFARQFLGVEDTKGPRGKLKPKGKHKKAAATSASRRRTPAGKDQAVQAVKQGAGGSLPVLYPTVRTQQALYAGPRACTSCAARTASATAPTGWCSSAASWASTTASRAPPGRTRRSSRTRPRSARSAGAPTSCTTTATGCAWSPGARARPSTGCPTRCCSPSASAR